MEAPPRDLEGRSPDDLVQPEMLETSDLSELCQLGEEQEEADPMTVCCGFAPVAAGSCPKRRASKTSAADAVDELLDGC